MADIYVNSEELKSIASGMKVKAANIIESYQNDASSAILMGGECLQISGLDTTTLLNSFNKIFMNINTRISTLADFLSTTVANEYDSTTASITNEFNNNFANELAGILGISVGASKVTNNSGIATPWSKGEELDPGFSQPSTPSTGDSSNALPNDENRTNYDGNKRKDPEYSYRNNPSIGNGTATSGSDSASEPVTLPNPAPNPGDSKPGIATPWPKGEELDPGFSYPGENSPSTGTDTTIHGTGGSISTPTPLPGNTTLTPGTNNDANIDPGMSYSRENNIPNMNIPSTETNTSTGITTPSYGNGSVGGIDPDMSYPNYGNMKNLIDSRIDDIKINPVKRPIYELPVQPKPKPEIMSTNNILR